MAILSPRFSRDLSRWSACAFVYGLVARLASGCGGHVAPPIPETALRPSTPRLVGRFDAHGRFAWSASTIQARFSGTGIFMRLKIEPFKADDPNFPPVGDHEARDPSRTGAAPEKRGVPYTVAVDDLPPRTFDVYAEEIRYELASNLSPDREHFVSVTRESEAFAGVHQLLGLEVATGGELLPPREKALKLLFVGDSISCGYGVLGANKTCKFSYATERATLAYPWLAAKALDAEPTVVCWSGRGVYRNYDGPPASGPEQLLVPQLFERTIPQSETAFPFATAPQPAAVIVNLGTNDFFADHDRDGRPDPIDGAAFEKAYDTFLARVREVHPSAILGVATSPMLSGTLGEKARASLDAIVGKRKKAGDEKIDLLVLEEEGDRQGCDGHPNAEAQRAAAKQVETFLRGKLGPH